MPDLSRWTAYPAALMPDDGSKAYSPKTSQCAGVWLVPASLSADGTWWNPAKDWWERRVRLPDTALILGDAEIGCGCVLQPSPGIPALADGEWMIVLFLHAQQETNFQKFLSISVKPGFGNSALQALPSLPALISPQVAPATDDEVQQAIATAFLQETQQHGGSGHMDEAAWQPPAAAPAP